MTSLRFIPKTAYNVALDDLTMASIFGDDIEGNQITNVLALEAKPFALIVFGEKLMTRIKNLPIYKNIIKLCKQFLKFIKCQKISLRDVRSYPAAKSKENFTKGIVTEKCFNNVVAYTYSNLSAWMQPSQPNLFCKAIYDRLLKWQPGYSFVDCSFLQHTELFDYFTRYYLDDWGKMDITTKSELISAIATNTFRFNVWFVLMSLRNEFSLVYDTSTKLVHFGKLKTKKLILAEENKIKKKHCELAIAQMLESISQNIEVSNSYDLTRGFILNNSGMNYHETLNSLQERLTMIVGPCTSMIFNRRPISSKLWEIVRIFKTIKEYPFHLSEFLFPPSQDKESCIRNFLSTSDLERLIVKFFRKKSLRFFTPKKKSVFILAKKIALRFNTWKLSEDFVDDTLESSFIYFGSIFKCIPKEQQKSIYMHSVAFHTFRFMIYVLLVTLRSMYTTVIGSNNTVRFIAAGHFPKVIDERELLSTEVPNKETIVSKQIENGEEDGKLKRKRTRSKCITILDSPEPAAKTSKLEPALPLSVKQEVNTHKFDLKKVKQEKTDKTLATSAPVTNPTTTNAVDLSRVKKESIKSSFTAAPSINSDIPDDRSDKSEDITRDVVDFKRFKADIDADPNIQAVYKTIFGLIIDNREALRTRYIDLLKENAKLKDIIRAMET